MPVVAISVDDADAYASWLSRNGIVGAHVCDDDEWERAARGADGREFTTGDRLAPMDANIDVTYGRDPWSFGPDEVGSHSASNSPFGVRDIVGNVKEIVISRGGSGPVSIRGGDWYHRDWDARLPAKFAFSETARAATVGFRVCSPAPQ
jgi:formylglycine-generating enzyme required for sulfatase activity